MHTEEAATTPESLIFFSNSAQTGRFTVQKNKEYVRLESDHWLPYREDIPRGAWVLMCQNPYGGSYTDDTMRQWSWKSSIRDAVVIISVQGPPRDDQGVRERFSIPKDVWLCMVRDIFYATS